MEGITIRLAEEADASRLNAALQKLSEDLGDTHLASDEDVKAAGFGEFPCFSALLAESKNEVVAVVMFSPFFSTTRGAPGVSVSDLWVDSTHRGEGVARHLLGKVCDVAAEQWQCSFLRLNVYRENLNAIAAYQKLGFDVDHHETVMTLNARNFNSLRSAKK